MARWTVWDQLPRTLQQAWAAIGREFGHGLLTAVIDLPEPH